MMSAAWYNHSMSSRENVDTVICWTFVSYYFKLLKLDKNKNLVSFGSVVSEEKI
jgi:hypothetical protein